MNFLQMDLSYTIECVLKILSSMIIGFVLGVERKSRNQMIGTRTLILISVSSTLLCILSSHIFYISGLGDPNRISAQVVSGIGFIGGGAIMKQGLNIKGLTSAAVIWTAAALGLAVGNGLYAETAFTLIAIIFVLVFLEKLEEKLFPAGRSKTLHLCFESETIDTVKVKEVISRHGFIVCDLNMSRVLSVKQIILHYSVKAPREDDFTGLIEDLKLIADLSEFSITD